MEPDGSTWADRDSVFIVMLVPATASARSPRFVVECYDLVRRRHDRIVFRTSGGECVCGHLCLRRIEKSPLQAATAAETRELEPVVERRETRDEFVSSSHVGFRECREAHRPGHGRVTLPGAGDREARHRREHGVRTPVRLVKQDADGFVHSVAKDDDLRGPSGEQGLEVLDVAFGPETVADLAVGPCQTADAELFVGMSQLQARFKLSGLERALHHPTAVEDDAVARSESVPPRRKTPRPATGRCRGWK